MNGTPSLSALGVGMIAGAMVLWAGVGTLQADTQVIQIDVVNDLNKGVQSRLVEIDREDKSLKLGETDGAGRFNEVFTCKQHHAIKANPIAGPYNESRPVRCKPQMKIIVRNPRIVTPLFKLAEEAKSNGKLGKAALLFNETYARSRTVNQEIAEQARVNTLLSVAKVLNVDIATVVDMKTGRTVASPTLVEKVVKFQEAAKIKPVKSGAIDARTLHALSGESLGKYIAMAERKVGG